MRGASDLTTGPLSIGNFVNLIRQTVKQDKLFQNPKLAILNFTRPGMYTKVMRKYISKNDISDFAELDVKFNNNGIFKIKGSSVRHYTVPSYTYVKNLKICN